MFKTRDGVIISSLSFSSNASIRPSTRPPAAAEDDENIDDGLNVVWDEDGAINALYACWSARA